jgi:hypothetical protein
MHGGTTIKKQEMIGFTRHVAVVMQAESEDYSSTILHCSDCITHHMLVDSADITLNFGEL